MTLKIGDTAKNKKTGTVGKVIRAEENYIKIKLITGVEQGGPPSIFEKVD